MLVESFVMPARFLSRLALLAVLLLACAPSSYADGAKLGFAITVDGDGFVLNPVVTKVRVTSVEKGSLAASAGMVAGDEILQIEGHPVAGKRARELQPYMAFGPGETRILHLRHASGEEYDARLTKPKE